MEYDIIIPSKGRPDGTTFKLLQKCKKPFIIVIEKDDEIQYRSHIPNATFWILPKSNQGIGYSRSYILNKTKRPFVMIDDDIRTIYKYNENAKMKRISLCKLLHMGWVYFTKHKDIGLLGFKEGTFAIPAVHVTETTSIAHILFMNPELLRKQHVRYDRSLRVFEDIDILFQCVQKKIRFERMNHLIYFTTPSGTHNKGGVDYQNRSKQNHLDVMVKRYPDWIVNDDTVRSRDHQPKYHIQWNKIRSNQKNDE